MKTLETSKMEEFLILLAKKAPIRELRNHIQPGIYQIAHGTFRWQCFFRSPRASLEFDVSNEEFSFSWPDSRHARGCFHAHGFSVVGDDWQEDHGNHAAFTIGEAVVEYKTEREVLPELEDEDLVRDPTKTAICTDVKGEDKTPVVETASQMEMASKIDLTPTNILRQKITGDLAQKSSSEYPPGNPFLKQQVDRTIAYHLRSQPNTRSKKVDAIEDAKQSAPPYVSPYAQLETHLNATLVHIKPTRTRLPDDAPRSTISSSKPQYPSLLLKRPKANDGLAEIPKRRLLPRKTQRSVLPSRPRVKLLPATKQQNGTDSHAPEPATKKRQRPSVSAVSPAEPSQKAKKRRTQK
ncbi:hypothetical protein GLAREA_07237 [Glarea lozoyensis ATCC 20868]|uniref:Uncharacterized protein n=2 Tax=Glarea lozoyensis TaxID=101852 RepID=S3DAT8_GLAL2|nr:uncharacterized protein GLAREA_07237 [Glarea lozoyensis ATCC 20868]EHK96138.1 hypothetical protein M7I_8173 [Glarea lozoyensis 74030]EPE34224.1 hypothetical protein GLAREA_07237 [Glarea lozoyensis ATCC 20868]